MDEFIRWWRNASRIIVLTGAGISTSSGLPDFTGANASYKGYSVKDILTRDFADANKAVFRDYCRDRLYSNAAFPSTSHKFLANAESRGYPVNVITQNIDGLHQKAGSMRVTELHGNMDGAHCSVCGTQMPIEAFFSGDGCSCGGCVRPNIILYGESLPSDALIWSESICANADLFLVVGTRMETTAPVDLMRLTQATGGKTAWVGLGMPPERLRFDYIYTGESGAFFNVVSKYLIF